jgi:hypothetical protein
VACFYSFSQDIFEHKSFILIQPVWWLRALCPARNCSFFRDQSSRSACGGGGGAPFYTERDGHHNGMGISYIKVDWPNLGAKVLSPFMQVAR